MRIIVQNRLNCIIHLLMFIVICCVPSTVLDMGDTEMTSRQKPCSHGAIF